MRKYENAKKTIKTPTDPNVNRKSNITHHNPNTYPDNQEPNPNPNPAY